MAGTTFPLVFPATFGPTLVGANAAPAVSIPAAPIVDPEQWVSLHTHKGVQLYQFGPGDLQALQWGMEHQEVSGCDLTVPSTLDYNKLPDIIPWLHWISVFSGAGELYWTGPIQKLTADRAAMAISSRDVGAFLSRTITPLTKRWDSTDLGFIARELWDGMIEAHDLNVTPITRADPDGGPFDHATKSDASMLDKEIDDLVALGLRWSVVRGVPILGPPPTKPVAALGEEHFAAGSLSLTRDGSASYNDVLLRGADNIARERVDMAGLNLQTIVTVDNMFGVSNVDQAVRQYLRYTSSIRDSLSVASGAVLDPSAPVHISDLIPGTRFTIDVYGLHTLVELTAVQVTRSQGVCTVGVSMDTVNDLPELAELAQNGVTGATGAR